MRKKTCWGGPYEVLDISEKMVHVDVGSRIVQFSIDKLKEFVDNGASASSSAPVDNRASALSPEPQTTPERETTTAILPQQDFALPSINEEIENLCTQVRRDPSTVEPISTSEFNVTEIQDCHLSKTLQINDERDSDEIFYAAKQK